MHPKRIWRNKGFWLCVAATGLPMVLCAQQNPPTPQSRFFQGNRGWGNHNNPSATVAPAPTPAPAVLAKPSAAVPASQLPPMPVVTLPPPPPPLPATPANKPAHRATVTYEDSLLTVKAHNSSLNQILRAIMRETGLQITGGVNDERVYGVYGPDRVPSLLASLLDGTGTNILYMPATADQPAQLTLTPRAGQSAPPPPSVTASDDLLPDGPEDDSTPQLATSPNAGPSIPGQLNPGAQLNGSAAASAAPGTVDPFKDHPEKRYPVPPRTTDEIYQQLLQLHAAQQKLGAQQQAAPVPAAPAAPN